ncbi:hypothetical protein XENOCAPTIV_015463 [Xenoophorus captivus]|uniref:Uncharacterized protein n=1 Tax=Xenoophorus captivus TaxID=1517983 RepID=A0ABV0S419_9TELE
MGAASSPALIQLFPHLTRFPSLKKVSGFHSSWQSLALLPPSLKSSEPCPHSNVSHLPSEIHFRSECAVSRETPPLYTDCRIKKENYSRQISALIFRPRFNPSLPNFPSKLSKPEYIHL